MNTHGVNMAVPFFGVSLRNRASQKCGSRSNLGKPTQIGSGDLRVNIPDFLFTVLSNHLGLPRRRAAARRSRVRSAISSRSNWANESKMLRVKRPMEWEVLSCWVTATKETPWHRTRTSHRRGSSPAARRGSQSTGSNLHSHPLRPHARHS